MKLLIVEDNRRIASHIRAQFAKRHIVDMAASGEDGLRKAVKTDYDIIVLDLGLPDMSGLEVCRQLRLKEVDSPILVLTGFDEVESKIKLLNSGADDYLTKPYHTAELVARVSAVARRKHREYKDEELRVHDLILNKTRREVTRSGTAIRLRRKEFDILEYLVSNKGRSLSREMILRHAWDSDRENWNNTVDVHIKHLRDKIDKPFSPALIKTAYGVGYMVDNDS